MPKLRTAPTLASKTSSRAASRFARRPPLAMTETSAPAAIRASAFMPVMARTVRRSRGRPIRCCEWRVSERESVVSPKAAMSSCRLGRAGTLLELSCPQNACPARATPSSTAGRLRTPPHLQDYRRCRRSRASNAHALCDGPWCRRTNVPVNIASAAASPEPKSCFDSAPAKRQSSRQPDCDGQFVAWQCGVRS